MTYRELQTALKNLRNAGYDIQVKLNASLEILQAEYNRLTAITPEQPQEPLTAEMFNEWVGLPCEQANGGNKPSTKQQLEPLEVFPDGSITPQLSQNIKEPTETPSQQLEESRAIAQKDHGNCKPLPKTLKALWDKHHTTVASQ